MTERYLSFQEGVVKLRKDIYKLRQKIKVGLKPFGLLATL